MMGARHDDEEQLVIGYVAGELEEAERLRFEQRLAAEPALAERLLAFEAMDLVGESLRAMPPAAAAPPPTPLRARRWPFVALAAAAAIVAAVLWPTAHPAIPCQVRAVASHGAGDLAGYADRLGLPAGMRYLGESRGDPRSATGVSAGQFLSAIAVLEAERGAQAFATPQQVLDDAFFTLRVQVDRECHALVLRLDAGGRWSRCFPARADAPVFGEATNPLSQGLHTLPRPVVVLNAIGTLSLYPGIDLPSDVTSNQAWLVLALRARAIEPETFAALDRLLAATAAPPDTAVATPAAMEAWVTQRSRVVLAWLDEHEFTPHRITVQRS